MEVVHTHLEGCFVIKPAVFDDPRGYFFESFNEERFNKAADLAIHFVQDNQSFSSYGVLRGLHFQKGEHAQAKLVRVLQGEVLDVAVDIRKGSPTFGKHFSVVLSAENKLQLFIPRGFAHGFVVLSDVAEFFYKCDNYYNKASEGGLLYNDADLNINWHLPLADILVSDKDKINSSFSELENSLYA
ncbi:dTDP-4-dehydrorhamnose 3,5-epimerase [Pontibacter sp. SGAir0037]|uniref:dTDP-4-dehydrorhamnose 3,5-epimerase n=1 Tax=Pontibacter sp. SGAir0037 TaxID=2571030 RepID=UPI0010CCE2CF|nr:dTDP-4-dehydrorhamnose 3,5-epimerase [Pontibacter sp. SGAir0037]QCR20987.1 dTDP-4-dehydrorhamnose 3,5-epimerase [Pontibacter sp. SGAir0037]